MGLVLGFIPPPKDALADSSRVVSLYFDGNKKVISTEATTVRAALEDAGVELSQGDIVEPSLDTEIPVGFYNINVFRSRPVVVVDGENHRVVRTASQSPRLVAEMAGVKTYEEDTFEVSTVDDIADYGVVGQKIEIDRSTPVTINSDGTDRQVRTQQATVGGLLVERDVAIGAEDTLEPGRDAKITDGLYIKVNRVRNAVVKETQTIGRSVTTIKDDSLTLGTSKVKTEGSDGQKEVLFKINYQNGVEQARTVISEKVISQPVEKVVIVGTKARLDGDPVEVGRIMAAQRGWTGDQWNALYSLWMKESKWNPNSRNFWSGACGIPQAYPCSKITDMSVSGQIRWGLDYISGKYGNPVNAYSYFQRNNSY